MPHTHTNYQTSFCIEDPDGTRLTGLQVIILDWLVHQKQFHLLDQHRAEFTERGAWHEPTVNDSRVETECHADQHMFAWSVRYRHADRDLGWRRSWHLDVGLQKSKQVIIFFCRLSYAWDEENLQSEEDQPRPSVPGFIHKILEQPWHVFSGGREFRLINKPAQFLESGQAPALAEFIRSPERRYPLIVINGGGDALLAEARQLARALAGKVQVAVIAHNEAFARELRHHLPLEYRIDLGKLRVFFPFSHRQLSMLRHRWYEVLGEDYQHQRASILNGLLRNHAVVEPGSVESVDAVRHLITRAKLEQIRATSDEQRSDLATFDEVLKSVEDERDQYKQFADHFASECDQLKDQVRDLKWKIEGVEARLNSADGAERPQFTASFMPRLPKSLGEVVTAAIGIYSNLEFAEDAVKSAAGERDCECIAETWEILHALNYIMHSLKFDGKKVKDLEAEFNNVCRYKYAKTEGKQTKHDNSLMALRQIQHQGKAYDITPHIKHGNGAPKMVRVHIAFDEDRRKIVVGYVGSHMPNATTRTI